MNTIFENDSKCASNQLSLATYDIQPLTKILGILQWVHNTKVFKDLIEREMKEVNYKNFN